ncbi:hypothetical protein ACFSDD_18235 [Salipiger marinus]|jgi:hypothetical protein|uniref:Uncharacterized protein n=1 Tax=Salipiger marinus TaxID=555512 RepID=A0A1G8L1N9_9RHOB|nr:MULTISPECIES: hypothetical protein [Salipiger]MEB3421328.1 hypothetical protein [Salipiger manganoxidans]SDI49605.1 hypothetical protein SAMN04487993_1005229 [Salipiger marinus]|tara:strand:+ start:1539 stop:1664 length:126 start_codon:yes stop_codon:yes gene_type:complete
MKAMLSGFAAIIIIGVAAWYGLHQIGLTSAEVYSSPAVRLD